MTAFLAWYIAIQALALAVWPLVRRAVGGFDDRGWALAKPVGLLALAWPMWFLGLLSPLPFNRGVLLLVLIVLAVASWSVEARSGELERTLAWLNARRALLLAIEAVFLAGFILFALLRAHEPAIQSFEKPMDMAFLNGLVTAQQLPTQDSWLAGFGEPYYYFGYFIFACLAKLTNVGAAVGFNLAAACVPALAIVSIGALIWDLARTADVPEAWSAVGAAAGAFLAFLAGNLRAVFDWLFVLGRLPASAGSVLGIKNFGDGLQPGTSWPPPNSLWWFNASRVLPNQQPDGINEFPFFTAYLSDLHPHLMAMPFEVASLAVGTLHVVCGAKSLRSPWTQGLAALVLGSLLTTNTWDIAPFWLLYVILAAYAGRGLAWRERLVTTFAAPVIGTLLFAPYFVGYHGPPLGLGIVTQQTPFSTFLVLFGPQVVLLLLLGAWLRWQQRDDRQALVISGVALLLFVVLAALGHATFGLLLLLLGLLAPLPRLLPRLEPAYAVLVGVLSFAVLMLIGVELIYLDDVFHSRMNTLFKFHENVWVLLGLGLGLGLALLFARRTDWRRPALAVLALCLAGGLVYPASAIVSRLGEQPTGGVTLNGMAFLPPEELAAVTWLHNQQGSQRIVIAEAVGDEYTDAARMATYSGGADILGWAGHELQWRGPVPELSTRQADLASIYRDAQPSQVLSLLRKYGANVVVVGDLERQKYGSGVDSRFAGLLPVAFQDGGTTIYRVPAVSSTSG